ncbi:MAG: hypothetical protein AMXMBFR64_40670 [Myxococcales bacterium]
MKGGNACDPLAWRPALRGPVPRPHHVPGPQGGPKPREIKVKRGVTSQTAWLLAQALGTTPQFWMNLQSAYDLATARPDHQVDPIARAG